MRQQGPGDDLTGIIKHDDLAFVFGLEDIGETLDVVFHDFGIDDNSDRSSHERNRVFITRVEWHVEEHRVDILQVRDGLFIEGAEEFFFNESFDDIFARLDDVEVAPARAEFREHFLVGRIVFDGNLDSGFLRKVIDHILRDVFGPAVDAELFGGVGGSGECQCDGGRS